MRNIVLSIFVVLTLNSCGRQNVIEKPTSFEICKGVNIGNWVSESPLRGERRAKVFTMDDIDKLASYGFDHLRLPVDEDHLFNESGRADEETLSLIHETITRCKKNGMRIILDIHFYFIFR